jgi:hypothetical protein
MVAHPVPFAESIERRQSEREEVSCQVVLHTSYARMRGTLSDLATGGARFVAELVPREGISALLEWEGRETLCRVVWSREGACGLVFDRPISAHLVLHAAEERKAHSEAAAMGKIPLGQRRSGRLPALGD